MRIPPARRPAATLAALALLAALAAGCGGATPAPGRPAATAAATPPPTAATASPGRMPATAADPGAAERAAQLAVAGAVLGALGDLAAGRPGPAGLRPAVLEDLRRLIDGSDGVGRRCLVEFTVVGTPEWRVDPVAFVPLLGADGEAVAGSRDAGAWLTTTRLEGYRTAVTYRATAGAAAPAAPPPGSPCAPATPGVPVQLPDERHRALRGAGLAVLVEWRDGAWAATEARASGAGLP